MIAYVPATLKNGPSVKSRLDFKLETEVSYISMNSAAEEIGGREDGLISQILVMIVTSIVI